MKQNEVINKKWLELSNYLSADNFKHISFDFWNTLAFSNPKFKKERTEYIYNLLNYKYNKELINKAFSIVGGDYNSSLDNGGKCLTVNELYLKVFEYIGVHQNFDLEIIKSAIFELFLKYPPSISENFIKFLGLVDHEKITLSITSNTAFIPGFIIEKFLNQIGIRDNFSFCLFSDHVQVAKPNKKIFDIVLDLLNNKIQATNDVIHIGDNYKADYLGAKHSGLSAFYIDGNPPLINLRHALHVIKDINSVPFSPLEYSKFKFGDSHIAKNFGVELFNYFEKYHLSELITKHFNFLIYSSPYFQIPTSSYYLTQSFYAAFSDYLDKNQIKEVNLRFCKIRRCHTYTEDYGALNAEERFNLIKNDTYEFVNIPSKDDICIFIDDISITGTHQRVVEKLLDDCSIKTNSLFLYFAKLSNPEVCPSFENELNYSFVSNVTRLANIILSDSYKITTRTAKYILSLQKKDLEYLIGEIKWHKKHSILKELVNMSDANEYNKTKLYKQNLKILKRCVIEYETELINLK